MSINPSLHFAGNQSVKPPQQPVNGGGIRSTIRNNVPTAAHEKLVQVRLQPLIPLILAISALTYHEGQQKKMAEDGNREASSTWQGVVAESAIGYGLLKYTSGVYPLLGLGLAICRASKENNALDQLKAVITTAVTMGMGFIGANLLDPDVMENMENSKIKALLETGGEDGEKLNQWLKALTRHDNEHLKAMGQHFSELKEQFFSKMPEAEQQKHSKAELKLVREKIGEIKARLAETIDRAGVEAIDLAESHGAKNTAEGLLTHIGEGQSAVIKLTRAVNPVCCFMFSAFLLGTPIANWINGHLEHRRPDLKKKAMKQALFPESQRVWKRPEEKEQKIHSYQVNPGPYISCPDVGGGRPMQ